MSLNVVRPLLYVATGAVFSFFLSLSSLADTASRQQLSLYVAAPDSIPVSANKLGADSAYRIGQLKTGAYGLPDDFTAKANLAFKVKAQPMVMGVYPFIIGPSSNTPIQNSWLNTGDAYVWNGDAQGGAVPLNLALSPESGEKRFQLMDFNEFWLDYSPMPGISMCMPKLEFQFMAKQNPSDPKTPWQRLVRTSAPEILEAQNTIDFSRDGWQQKSYAYVLRRMLGLAPDANWHYVQKQDVVVMQRRMHASLDDIDALDIMLAADMEATGVNIFIGREDNFGAGEIFEFRKLQKTPGLAEGRSGVRLNLRKALEGRYPNELMGNAGKYHFYLQEISVFIPGRGRALAAEKPVHGLVFLKDAQGVHRSEQLSHKLESNNYAINAYRQRLSVDFRALEEQNEVTMQGIRLWLTPPIGAKSCAIRINSLQAANVYNGSVPVFADFVESWSRHFGGVFNLFTLRRDQVENPGIIAYLPFPVLTSHGIPQGGALGYEISSAPKTETQSVLPSYRIMSVLGKKIAPDKLHMVSTAGAVLKAEGEAPVAALENDLLVLEGKSKALDISWPLVVQANGNTWFYLGMAAGINQVESANLTLELADGSTLRQKIVPNQPFPLGGNNVEIRGVRLHMVPKTAPFRLKLRELAFFSPMVAGYAQAFSVALPTVYSASPQPILSVKDTKELKVQPGRIFGSTGDGEPLRFTTWFNPSLDWVRGIRLSYHLPPGGAAKNRCLELRFKWANGNLGRQVCFNEVGGSLFIPMADFFDAGDKPNNLGVLQSIDWVLNPFSDANSGDKGVFDFQFAVEGWTKLSAADRLRLSALVFAGDSRIHADAAHVREIATAPYAQKIWLRLEDNAMSQIVAAKDAIQPVKNGQFTLEGVVAEPKQSMDLGHWRELSTAPQPFWLKWWVWVILVTSAWGAMKKGWWSPSEVWSLGTHIGRGAHYLLQWILHAAGRVLSRVLPQLNRLIGLLSLVVAIGSALTIYEEAKFQKLMVLVTALLIAWGTYCHQKEFVGFMRPKWRISRLVGLIGLMFGIGCGAWSVGALSIIVVFPNAKSLWGFAPLLGAAYAFLPTLYNTVSQYAVMSYRLVFWVVIWLILALGLYGISLLANFGDEGKYFFTIGGLIVIFALRSVLLAVAPDFRRFFPATAAFVYGRVGGLFSVLSYRFAFLMGMLAPIMGGWSILTLGLYGAGLFADFGDEGKYFFTVGGLTAVFALRSILLLIAPYAHQHFPALAKRIYAEETSLYFSLAGVLVVVVATMTVLSVRLWPVAEQLAIVVYYSLVIGTVKEAMVLRRRAAGPHV